MKPTTIPVVARQLLIYFGLGGMLCSAGLVMAIVGGAFMPVLQGYILDLGGPGVVAFYGYRSLASQN